jgi:hypothetical protein
MLRKTTEEYLQQLIDLEVQHTLLGEYTRNNDPTEHECTQGHVFLATPSNILNGRGCPVCSGKVKKTTESYQAELDSLGKGYRCLEPYINNHTKLRHMCDNSHEWEVAPKDLVGHKRTNCPYCIKRYIDYDDTAYLYYIKIDKNGEQFYKVGITKNTLEERYKGSDLDIITCLMWKEYDKGWKAAEQEKEILKEFSDHIYKDPTLLKRGGAGSEIFSEDVLQLEQEYV